MVYKLYHHSAEGSGGSGGAGATASPSYDFDFGGITEVGGTPAADPTKGTDAQTKTEGAEGVGNPPAADVKKVEQTPEQNRAFAEMRKQAETGTKQMKMLNDKITSLFGETHGVKDIFDYIDRLEKQSLKDMEDELKEQGIDPAKDPAYQQMLKQNQLQEEQLKDMQGQLDAKEQEDVTKQAADDFLALKKEFDWLKTPKDLDAKTVELYQNGMDLKDAYWIANKDKIKQNIQEAARQEAINSINSKQHLKTEGDGGDASGDVAVDPDTLQMYMDNGMSKAEALAFHKKFMNY